MKILIAGTQGAGKSTISRGVAYKLKKTNPELRISSPSEWWINQGLVFYLSAGKSKGIIESAWLRYLSDNILLEEFNDIVIYDSHPYLTDIVEERQTGDEEIINLLKNDLESMDFIFHLKNDHPVKIDVYRDDTKDLDKENNKLIQKILKTHQGYSIIDYSSGIETIMVKLNESNNNR